MPIAKYPGCCPIAHQLLTQAKRGILPGKLSINVSKRNLRPSNPKRAQWCAGMRMSFTVRGWRTTAISFVFPVETGLRETRCRQPAGS